MLASRRGRARNRNVLWSAPSKAFAPTLRRRARHASALPSHRVDTRHTVCTQTQCANDSLLITPTARGYPPTDWHTRATASSFHYFHTWPLQLLFRGNGIESCPFPPEWNWFVNDNREVPVVSVGERTGRAACFIILFAGLGIGNDYFALVEALAGTFRWKSAREARHLSTSALAMLRKRAVLTHNFSIAASISHLSRWPEKPLTRSIHFSHWLTPGKKRSYRTNGSMGLPLNDLNPRLMNECSDLVMEHLLTLRAFRVERC
jgi:hypothetical protein